MTRDNRYFLLYLGLVFGVWWSSVFILVSCRDFLAPYIGTLSFFHPLVIFFMYLPSLAALMIYFLEGGWQAVSGLLFKLIPRKQDLYLFPVLAIVGLCFVLTMRFGSLLLGMPIPEITYSPYEIFVKAVFNFFAETPLIGGCLGWVGFLLPYLQAKLANSTVSGLITGLFFGLWALAVPFLLNATVNVSYWLYILQTMTFFAFVSYVFNVTKGTICFYLFIFWLVATGSHVQMYFFNQSIQYMQIGFFMITSLLAHLFVRKTKQNMQLEKFPSYVYRHHIN